MSDVGNELRGTWGEGLTKYGRARAKLAAVGPNLPLLQRLTLFRLKRNSPAEWGNLISAEWVRVQREGKADEAEGAMGVVNEYKTMRKKLDSRR